MFARKSTPESRIAARDSANKWGERELAVRHWFTETGLGQITAASTVVGASALVGWVENLPL